MTNYIQTAVPICTVSTNGPRSLRLRLTPPNTKRVWEELRENAWACRRGATAAVFHVDAQTSPIIRAFCYCAVWPSLRVVVRSTEV